jgi:ABC-2 type transport system permease protein
LLNELAEDEDGEPIEIEAYVGSTVPTEYVKTKFDLVNLLREFNVMGGNRVQVNVHQGVEPFSEEAILAEKRFGIRPQKVSTLSRGAPREEDVILGVAVSSGKRRIINPFMSYGMPVEYDLMRAINSVSQDRRKVIGVVQTDALINGAVVRNGERASRIPKLKILEDLEKQYDVEQINATNEIELWTESDGDDSESRRRYDVLLVVQPSKMTPVEMENLISAIQSGQPAVIFEDPYPVPDSFPQVGGTFFPRRFARGSQETAKIEDLWNALDLDIDRNPGTFRGLSMQFPWLVWRNENFYQRDMMLARQREMFVIRNPSGAIGDDIPEPMRDIKELFFQYSGIVKQKPTSTFEFVDLVKVSQAGRLNLLPWLQYSTGEISEQRLANARGLNNSSFVLAAQIKGSNAGEIVRGSAESKDNTNVIYVADMDLLADYFVDVQNAPIRNNEEYRFQNMSFVLNLVDWMADESKYLKIRNRRVDHVTLGEIDKRKKKALDKVAKANNDFEIEYETERKGFETELFSKTKTLRDEIDRLEKKKVDGKPYDSAKLAAKKALLDTESRQQQQRMQNRTQELNIERLENQRRVNLEAELEIQKIQQFYKLCAVVVPPIPPLIVGIIVFFRRRLREREGISKARRLK